MQCSPRETSSARRAAAAQSSSPLLPGLRPECPVTGTWKGLRTNGSDMWAQLALGRPSSPAERVFVVFCDVLFPRSRKADSGPWSGSRSAGGLAGVAGCPLRAQGLQHFVLRVCLAPLLPRPRIVLCPAPFEIVFTFYCNVCALGSLRTRSGN